MFFDVKIYRCANCGNVVFLLHNGGGQMTCCGSDMERLNPEAHFGAKERHISVVSLEKGLVKATVGAIEHPMDEKHYIQWVALVNAGGIQIKHFKPDTIPSCYFTNYPGQYSFYSYCSQHGLWGQDGDF